MLIDAERAERLQELAASYASPIKRTRVARLVDKKTAERCRTRRASPRVGGKLRTFS
ncbi:MAG: hypothetical protein V7L00_27560 [Nostoc sp.]|uniref:hypothetical protein n=1 Tax=Nostoc sp. TaxID=1180 RepID=UPI002FF4D74B